MITAFTVLEFGTYTGFSALCWYEGTRSTNAEIITLDIRHEVVEAAEKAFKDFGVDDRIRVLEGSADSSYVAFPGKWPSFAPLRSL